MDWGTVATIWLIVSFGVAAVLAIRLWDDGK